MTRASKRRWMTGRSHPCPLSARPSPGPGREQRHLAAVNVRYNAGVTIYFFHVTLTSNVTMFRNVSKKHV